MSKSLVPFLVIGGVAIVLGTQPGMSRYDPPINYATSPPPYNPVGDLVSPAAQAVQPHIDQYRAGAERASAAQLDLQYNVARIANQMLLDAEQGNAVPPLRNQLAETFLGGAATYNNGYTDSGHQNTLIGNMIHQMATEGQLRPETVKYANDVLSRCAVLKPPKPPICN